MARQVYIQDMNLSQMTKTSRLRSRDANNYLHNEHQTDVIVFFASMAN